MSDALIVTATEFGMVRLFKLGAELEAEIAKAGNLDRLEQALGPEVSLDPEQVQIAPTEGFTTMPLRTLLIDGYDVAAQLVAGEEYGTPPYSVAVIRSAGFITRPVTLTPNAEASFLAIFKEGQPDPVRFDPLPDTDAKGTVANANARPSDAAMSGRVAMVALLVLFALVGLMIWMA